MRWLLSICTLPSTMTLTSVVVPPMSNEMTRSRFKRRATEAAAATPAAGPDSASASGRDEIEAAEAMPPAEWNMCNPVCEPIRSTSRLR